MDTRHDQRDHSLQAPELPEPVASRFAQHRFVIMIAGSVVIALVLVTVSLQLYFSSGTAQLDLSRPGYRSVRDQIRSDATFDGFPATGAIDESALKNFKELYEKRAKDATSTDAFGSDVLSEQTLGIDAPTDQPQ